ncbi:MAG TPA: nuclear transport factor 2 family protein [Anaerolineales bacterium]|nr:nuclear transport factor 2 family protein [Anaerolineales bacterium]HRQ91760.1 nuclear transport factor 2 family protein [Anaerolineales bacterium]
MSILSGKGMYLWIISRVEGGDPQKIAELAQQAGLTHVLIKVADRNYKYNIDNKTGHDYVPGVVSALRARGIQPWGWQYIYGTNPAAEAQIAIQRTKEFNLDGFVVNAEVEFKQKNMETPARQYMKALRAGLPNTPIGFSSYRYPTLHRPLPFETFLEYSDINMPQVYWIQASNPAAQLLRSVREHQALSVWRPILPTGAAYPDGDWNPTAAQVTDFMQACKDNNISGANFWEWYYARRISGIWDAVKNFSWPTSPAPTPDISIRFLDALNSQDPVKVTALYGNSGVHVNAQRTVQGSEGILRWYNSLLRETLPGARFEITGSTTQKNLRVLTWTATSSKGRVLDGKDSLGIQNDKIAYHYTYFTVR